MLSAAPGSNMRCRWTNCALRITNYISKIWRFDTVLRKLRPIAMSGSASTINLAGKRLSRLPLRLRCPQNSQMAPRMAMSDAQSPARADRIWQPPHISMQRTEPGDWWASIARPIRRACRRVLAQQNFSGRRLAEAVKHLPIAVHESNHHPFPIHFDVRKSGNLQSIRPAGRGIPFQIAQLRSPSAGDYVGSRTGFELQV